MTFSRTTHRKSLKNNIYNNRTHKLKHIKNGNKKAKSMPHLKKALKGSRKKQIDTPCTLVIVTKYLGKLSVIIIVYILEAINQFRYSI